VRGVARSGLLGVVIAIVCGTGVAGATTYPLSSPPERIPGAPGNAIELLDFDGDGLLDIASVTTGEFIEGAHVTLVRGLPSGWAPEQVLRLPGTGAHPMRIAAADITGDGRDDMLLTLGNGTLAVLRGNAGAALTLPPAGRRVPDSHRRGRCADDRSGLGRHR